MRRQHVVLATTTLIALMVTSSPIMATAPGPKFSVKHTFKQNGDVNEAKAHWDSEITIDDDDGISNAGDKYGFDTLFGASEDLGVPGGCPKNFTKIIHNEKKVTIAEAFDCEEVPHQGFYRFFEGPANITRNLIKFEVDKPDAMIIDLQIENLADKDGGPLTTADFEVQQKEESTEFSVIVRLEERDRPGFLGVSVDPPGDLYQLDFLLFPTVLAIPLLSPLSFIVLILGLSLAAWLALNLFH